MNNVKGAAGVDIEILSVRSKTGLPDLSDYNDSIENKLSKNGFSLNSIRSTPIRASKITALLNECAKYAKKPDIIVIAEALNTIDSTSFKKNFAEVVANAERSENEPVPKDYWKKRNRAFADAKKRGASREELDELAEEFRVFKKKSKIFSLGDFGRSFKGYCFMYRGMRIAVLPKASLTGADIADMVCLACVRTKENFENSAGDYPGGFSKKEFVPAKTGFANQFIPMKGDGAKEITRKSVAIASFLVFLVALSLLFYNMVYLSFRNAELNGEIQRIAHGIEDDKSGDKKPAVDDKINWKKLLKINDEIVGWIQMKNTQVDYPVLWHKSDDRNGQYYLNHNYKGDYDSFGSIFLDYRCTKGTDSKNTVIHGHHIQDGSMFGDLMKYGGTTGNLDFYKKTPVIRFDTPDGDGTYKIISVFKTNTLSTHGEFFNYMIGNFQNEKDFMNYVYNVRVRSLFNCPVDVNEDDELITLSTCSYEFTNFRTVVVARKVRVGESKKVDVSKASLNKNPVWPEVYYSAYGGSRPTVTDFCTAYEKGQIDWYNGDYDFKNQKVQKPVDESTAPTDKSGQPVTQRVQPTTQAKVYCNVTFLNYDGSVINTQKVEYGKAAKAPKNPTKPSDEYYDYIFKGWQLDYSNVVCDLTIAPSFEAKLKPQYDQAQGGV